jgi:carboxyl-terminal processing protease
MVKNNTASKTPVLLLSILCILLTISTAFFAILYYKPSVLSQVTQTVPQLQAQTDLNSRRSELESILKSQFIGSTPSQEDLDTAQLKGYIAALSDPYTSYFTKKEQESFTGAINEEYVGIGIRFEFKDEVVNIEEVFSSSPAQKNGLKIGDKIIQVDDTKTESFTSSGDVFKKITGPKGSEVKLKIVSTNGVEDKTLVREKITRPLVESSFPNADTVVIKVNSFGQNLDDELKTVVNDERSKLVKNVIIDLQDDGGGYLESAVDLISYFTDANIPAVFEKTKTKELDFKTSSKPTTLKGKRILILQNGNSASASEISAGAIKELAGAKIAGTKSFGKGVVQQIFELKNGDSVKVTTGEWLTPKKNGINKVGILPDIEIKSAVLDTILKSYDWDNGVLK